MTLEDSGWGSGEIYSPRNQASPRSQASPRNRLTPPSPRMTGDWANDAVQLRLKCKEIFAKLDRNGDGPAGLASGSTRFLVHLENLPI